VNNCTLRDAIEAANAASGASLINFGSDFNVARTINLGSGLTITKEVIIQGTGANMLTVRRNTGGDYSVFTIDEGGGAIPNVTISGMTISNGNSTTGGGIDSNAFLTLDSVADLKKEKTDSLVSASMMLLLSGAIMAVAAGTLHVSGLKLDNTVEMINLFEPFGGKIAAFVLIIGITGAGLSTIFPIVLIAPWLISDYRGTPRNIHSTQSRLLIFVALLFAFGTVFIDERPPALMIFSQAFQACILPAVAIPIFILINRQKLMHFHKAGNIWNMAILAVILFSLLTTWFALTEFF
jgi:hypothetical protein